MGDDEGGAVVAVLGCIVYGVAIEWRLRAPMSDNEVGIAQAQERTQIRRHFTSRMFQLRTFSPTCGRGLKLSALENIPEMSIYPIMSLNAIGDMTETSAPTGGIERLQQILAAVPVTLGLPQLQAMVAVAASPGLSVNELAECLNVPQQTASRYVAQLMGRYQELGEKHEPQPIIEQRVSLSDPRKRALYLTWHGRKTIEKLIAAGWGN